MLDIEQYIEARESILPGRHLMTQTWSNLLFLHAAIEPNLIQSSLPNGLTVDTFPIDGKEMAWIGLVLFRMENVRFVGKPGIPTATNFPEFNMRTYVHREGREPGIWFYSLDASSRLACIGARIRYSLPYYWGRMAIDRGPGSIRYRCHRQWKPRAQLEGSASGLENLGIEASTPGTLEFFLAERYRLYALTRNGLKTGLVRHDPYQIAPIPKFEISQTLTTAALSLTPELTLAHFCPGVDVKVWPLER